MVKFIKFMLLIVFVLVIRANADQVRWNSTWADTDWFNQSNWDTSTVPGTSDFAFIERSVGVVLNGGSPTIDQLLVGGSGDPNSSLTVSTGETFTTNHLKIAEYAGTVGDVNVNGGDIVVNGTLRMSRADDAGCQAYLRIDSGTFTTGSAVLDEFGVTAGYGAFVDIKQGSFTVNGDVVSNMFSYVDNGQLTGYGEGENVRVKYADSKTTAYADDPDAALGSTQIRYHYAYEDGNWFNPMNWDVSNLGGGYRLPRLIDFAFVDRDVDAYLENGTAEVYDMFMGENTNGVVLTVGTGGVLNITRILAISEYDDSDGTMIVENGGVVNVIGTLRMSRNDSDTSFAKIIVNDGGSFVTRNLTFDQNGQVYGYGSRIELNGSGTFTRAFNRVDETNQQIADGIYYGNGVCGAVIAEYDIESDSTIIRAATAEEMSEPIWLTWDSEWEDQNWSNLSNWAFHSGSPSMVLRQLELTDYAFIDKTVEVQIIDQTAKAGRIFMGEGSQTVLTVGSNGSLEVGDNIYVARYDTSNATLKVDGGSVYVENTLYVSENDTSTCDGHVELISGEIECARLLLDAKGTNSAGATVNIQDGILKTNYSYLNEIEGYIADGRLTGFGDSTLVNTQLLDDRLWVWASDPNSAHNPSPEDFTMWLSPSSVTLSWDAGQTATSHNVYFGGDEIVADINQDSVVNLDDMLILLNDWLLYTKTSVDWNTDVNNNGIVDLDDFAVLAKNFGSDLSNSFKGNQTAATYNCGTLNYDQQYYWRVDEITPDGTVPSKVWRFKTAYDAQAVDTPIVWTATTPDYTQEAAGLPLAGAVHATVYSGSPIASGGGGLVNHFPFIYKYGSYYVASWINHPDSFDSAGTRTLYSTSTDGTNWTAAAPLVDYLSATGDSTVDGYVSYNQWFKEIDGKLYSIVKVRRKVSSSWVGDYYIARAYTSAAVADGEPFWLEDEAPEGVLNSYSGLNDLAAEDTQLYADAVVLAEYIEDYHDYYGPFASYGDRVYMTDADGNLLFEPAFFTRPDGTEVMIARAAATYNRLFATERIPAALWLPAVETNVQDSPALSTAGNLNDGTCYIIGNHAERDDDTERDPLTIALSDDGVHFDRAFTIRTTPYDRNYETSSRTGCQYPHAAVDGDYLWVIYSIHAQDIAISRIPLSALD
ncbi:MAG: exo-alpha-sialidase [Sedimentisphaeraceae bacterium JB056]